MLSAEERQLTALLNSNQNLDNVAEDFVELNIPGFDGSTTTPSSRSVAISPMLSLASASSGGGSRGGSFSGNSGKKFGVVKVHKDQGGCLADIGDGAKFCIKVDCSVASHRLAKNKFKPDDDGTIAIAKSRDVAFALPVLGGSVLPLDVQQEWSESEKTLEEWSQLFKASSTQDNNFSSPAEYESRLREQQSSELFKTPAKKKGQQSAYPMTSVRDLTIYSQAVTPAKKEAFQKSSPGKLTEIVLGMDDALRALSGRFFTHVTETQDAVLGLEMADSMLEMKTDSVDSRLGPMSVMGVSSFQNPTVFGTMAALARKVKDMQLVGPPTVDFSPIQAELEKFRSETNSGA
jgi:hypothetical protein